MDIFLSTAWNFSISMCSYSSVYLCTTRRIHGQKNTSSRSSSSIVGYSSMHSGYIIIKKKEAEKRIRIYLACTYRKQVELAAWSISACTLIWGIVTGSILSHDSLWKSIGGISCSPWKALYACKFISTLSDRLSMVSVRAPQWIGSWENTELDSTVPRLGSRGMKKSCN